MFLVKPHFEVLSVSTYPSEEAHADSVVHPGTVLEHVGTLSVRFLIDRGVSHELVCHRLCAFYQESTRYCNYKGGVSFVIPPWLDLHPGEYRLPSDFDNWRDLRKDKKDWLTSMLHAERAYTKLLEHGWSPQRARSVLPNSLKTEIVVTANFREWRHIFALRCDPAAHPQMREIMCPLLNWCRLRVPVVFEDLLEGVQVEMDYWCPKYERQ